MTRSRNLCQTPENLRTDTSQEELEEALQDAAERITAGELPEITAPLYGTAPPKRQPQGLRAVRAAG